MNDIARLQLKENENEIDKLLKEVAVLRYFHNNIMYMYRLEIAYSISLHHRRTGVGGKSVFELKSEHEKECSPFFYHYTRMDHSKVIFIP